MGGNTFCLRYEMRRSGFEDIIKKLLENGLVYGGESAGCLVAGTNLKGVEFADPLEFAEAIIWEGLGLVPHFVLPHVGNEDLGEAIEKAREMHKDDPELITLTDQQAFLVDGSVQKVVTGVGVRV
jgi:dipeptidase E